jgi:type III secretory pathway component EscV
MDIVSTALVIAHEEAAAEASQVSPWVFGASALVGFVVLLVVTLMIKVGD